MTDLSFPEISAARFEELPQILAWNAQTWAEHDSRQPGYFPPDRLAAMQAEIRASFGDQSRPEATSDRILAARIGGQLVGYIRFGAALGAKGVTTTSLDDICVAPSHRGQGIGGRLLARAAEEKACHGWQSLTAFTWGGNAASAATFAGSEFKVDFTAWRLGTWTQRPAIPAWRVWVERVGQTLPWIALGYLAARLLPHLVR